MTSSTSPFVSRRIAVVATYYHDSGGSEMIAKNIADGLQALGHRVDMVFLSLRPVQAAPDESGANAGSHLQFLQPAEHGALVQTIDEIAPDSVLLLSDIFSDTLNFFAELEFQTRFTKLAYININNQAFHFLETNEELARSRSLILKRYDAVVTMFEESLAASYFTKYDIPYQIIHIGIPEIPAGPASFKKRHGIPDDSHMLVYPALVAPLKNQVALIEMANLIEANVTVVFIGSLYQPIPEYVDEFQRAVEKSRNCRYLGELPRDQVAQAMSEASLCLFPSLSEGSPLTLLEALSHGLVWLAVPNVHFARQLRGGRVAKLPQFPFLIDQLLENPELLAAMGEEGKEFSRSHFRIADTVHGFSALIGELNSAPVAAKVMAPAFAPAPALATASASAVAPAPATAPVVTFDAQSSRSIMSSNIQQALFGAGHGLPEPRPCAPLADAPPVRNKVRIAGEGEVGKDLTQIQESSELEIQLRKLIATIKPSSIIETGTYLGTGTTRIIASALREAGLTLTRFFSIECNPHHHAQALNNLRQSGLTPYTSPLLGLSVPRALLPDPEQIEQHTVRNIEGDNIFVDHQEANRVALYFGETNFDGIPEDLLGECLRKVDYSPSIVLLDSGGHLGNVEFNYVIGKLRSPCYIVLDDVYHIKHHRSFQQIKQDSRFTLIASSEEKFGFCMAYFKPETDVQDLHPRNILLVRTDSIGDSVLAMTTLGPLKEKYQGARLTVLCQAHVAPLYRLSPHCDAIITFDCAKILTDDGYRHGVEQELASAGFDLCLTSVYSRTILTDFLVFSSGAPIKVGLEGDLSNMEVQDREANRRGYSHLIPSEGENRSELTRHRDFLKGIGINPAGPLQPRLTPAPEDYQVADRMFREAGIDPARTIVLFAGAQSPIRIFSRFGEAIKEICDAQGLSVVALGVAADQAINQFNLAALNTRTANWSGITTLGQSAAIMSRCRLALGTETGLAHIACAVGTPNVVLLGGGHFGRFMPYSPLTSIACLPLECYNCNWTCPYATPHCITGIDLRVLKRAVLDTLAGPGEKPRLFAQGHDMYRRGEGMPFWGLFNKLIHHKDVIIVPVNE